MVYNSDSDMGYMGFKGYKFWGLYRLLSVILGDTGAMPWVLHGSFKIKMYVLVCLKI